jgi:hypothetical protein
MGGLTTFNLRDSAEPNEAAAPGTTLEPILEDAAPEGRLVPKPTPAQRRYLERGLNQPGGKLPLFDLNGREIGRRTIRTCIERGWAEPWFPNPVKPDWVVCRVTDEGRAVLGD